MEENNSSKNPSQFLAFYLAGDIFAIDILDTKEVVEYRQIIKVPHMPEFMLGAINLRGVVLPVIDMRLKFGLPKGEITIDTAIIIVEVELNKENALIGILVDSIKEVIAIEEDKMSPSPNIGGVLNPGFIKTMASQGGQMIIVLDISKVLSESELIDISAIKPQDAESEESEEDDG